MQHTTNYILPQWEDSDRVTREAVNGAFSTIDGALGTMPRIAAGSYTGNGQTENEENIIQHFSLGFRPKLVILYVNIGASNRNNVEQYFIADAQEYRHTNNMILGVLTDDGFSVGSVWVRNFGYITPYLNMPPYTYAFIAIG